MSFYDLFNIVGHGGRFIISMKDVEFEISPIMGATLTEKQVNNILDYFLRSRVDKLILKILGRMLREAENQMMIDNISHNKVPFYITPFRDDCDDFMEGVVLIISPKKYIEKVESGLMERKGG